MSNPQISGDDQPPPEHKLQLEAIYGGPGSGGKTRIGAGEDGQNDPTPQSPATIPHWFLPIFPLARHFFIWQLSRLTPKEARSYCDSAKLTDDHLTVLNLRWHINLNLEWKPSGDTIKQLAPTESYLEKQAAWKLWTNMYNPLH